MDAALRHVTHALLVGVDEKQVMEHALQVRGGGAGTHGNGGRGTKLVHQRFPPGGGRYEGRRGRYEGLKVRGRAWCTGVTRAQGTGRIPVHKTQRRGKGRCRWECRWLGRKEGCCLPGLTVGDIILPSLMCLVS